ncbi:hypothetical protein H5410_041640 [Solanum commersonii]|uniref:Uncharacterized protein n=1 Tax=Solanum commersonii TaxID=4109 RepID=A0A9J5XW37_SOLCO|nr:hypothetical protein H5410_041640 [Solanum commersonii]
MRKVQVILALIKTLSRNPAIRNLIHNNHRSHGLAGRWPLSSGGGCANHSIDNRGSFEEDLCKQIKTYSTQHKPIPLKQIAYLHEEPRIVWKEEKVNQMIMNEHLQYAGVGNFHTGGLIFKI